MATLSDPDTPDLGSARRRCARTLFTLLALLAGCSGDNSKSLETKTIRQSSCGSGRSESRWARRTTPYVRLAEYGRDPGQELADVWGVGAGPGGQTLIWDAGNTQIVEVDPSFRHVAIIGRKGRGPGEFGYQRIPHGEWLAAGDSFFVALGITSGTFAQFTYRGRYLGSLTLSPPSPFSITRMTVRNARLFYSVDHIDERDGTRVLEMWRLEPKEPHTLLWQDTMPSLPLWHSRPVHGSATFDQADPLWSFDGRCAYVSDGGTDRILRVQLDSGFVDTIPVPHRPVPPRTKEDQALLDRLHRMVAAMGGSQVGPDVKPTLTIRWADVLIDPDGFVWLMPWRPYSYRNQPVSALVIDPSTGSVDSVDVPRFPSAFLPDGDFVALAWDSASDIPFVEHYGQK